jgi:hypothetical protein
MTGGGASTSISSHTRFSTGLLNTPHLIKGVVTVVERWPKPILKSVVIGRIRHGGQNDSTPTIIER